jgi:hypothetical protein
MYRRFNEGISINPTGANLPSCCNWCDPNKKKVASQDDIYAAPQEDISAEEEGCMTKGAAAESKPPREHTLFTPQRSGSDVTKFFTPGDKSDESFAANVNVALEESARLFHATTATPSSHTGTTEATLVDKTLRDSDYDTMKDYHRRRRHAWDSDSSEEDDDQRRPESSWKNKDGVPLALETVNRSTRKDVSPSIHSRPKTQARKHLSPYTDPHAVDSATTRIGDSTISLVASTPTITNLTPLTSTGMASRTRNASKKIKSTSILHSEFSVCENSEDEIKTTNVN